MGSTSRQGTTEKWCAQLQWAQTSIVAIFDFVVAESDVGELIRGELARILLQDNHEDISFENINIITTATATRNNGIDLRLSLCPNKPNNMSHRLTEM